MYLSSKESSYSLIKYPRDKKIMAKVKTPNFLMMLFFHLKLKNSYKVKIFIFFIYLINIQKIFHI